MKVLKLGLLVAATLLAGVALGGILEISSATVDEVGVSTPSTTFVDAQTVSLNHSGNVLVLGTLTSSGSAGFLELVDQYGAWQLHGGDQSSTPIERSMDRGIDEGSCSVVHVFTNLSSGTSLALQHKVSRGRQTITTRRVNLVAIPLTVSTGEKLKYGLAQQVEGMQTASQSYLSAGLETTVELDRSVMNGMYMAASFNAQALSGAESGLWMLQFRKVGETQWVDSGSPVQRSMSTTNDIGSITLYALEEGLATGTYDVRLAMRSVGGGAVETLNGTLAVVSLFYANATGGGYFDGVSMTPTNLVSMSEFMDVDPATLPAADIDLPYGGGGFVASLSFTGKAGEGSGEFGETGTFGLMVDGVNINQECARYFEEIGDFGSIASVGSISGMTDGPHRVLGYRSDNVDALGVTLVGFNTSSVYGEEPVPMADLDENGLEDSWEVTYFDNVSVVSPTDLAANEVSTMEDAAIAGFDPEDPDAIFEMDSLTDEAGIQILSWERVPGRIYTVYWTPDLTTAFTIIGADIPWDAPPFEIPLFDNNQQGFFRIEVRLEAPAS